MNIYDIYKYPKCNSLYEFLTRIILDSEFIQFLFYEVNRDLVVNRFTERDPNIKLVLSENFTGL